MVYEYAFDDHNFTYPKGENFPEVLHAAIQSARSLSRTCRKIRTDVRDMKLTNLTYDSEHKDSSDWVFDRTIQDPQKVITCLKVDHMEGYVFGSLLSNASNAKYRLDLMRRKLPAFRKLVVASSFAELDKDGSIERQMKARCEQYGIVVEIGDGGV